jgi:hypothetical protein
VLRQAFDSGFPVDMAIKSTLLRQANSNYLFDRLRGPSYVSFAKLTLESFGAAEFRPSTMGGITITQLNQYYSWMFKRATGFFDVVAYTGDGTSDRSNQS